MLEQGDQIGFLIVSGTFLTAMMGTFIVAMVVLHRQRQVQNRQKIDNLKSEYEKTLLNIENEIQQETLTPFFALVLASAFAEITVQVDIGGGQAGLAVSHEVGMGDRSKQGRGYG